MRLRTFLPLHTGALYGLGTVPRYCSDSQPHTLVLFLLTLLSSCLTTTTATGAGVTSGPSSGSNSHIQYIEDTFSDGTNHGNFNHLVVDRNTGRLYIGAINRLYQLSETLVQEKAITTGPKDDSP